MNAPRLAARLIIAGWLAACVSCSSGEDETDRPAAVEETVRQLPRIAGTPTDAGYFDRGVTLLAGTGTDSGAPLAPVGRSSPMAVRLEVAGNATLVPSEYTVVIDKRRYRPKGISFGEARQTFFDLEKFVADQVELSQGGSDQITTDEAGKLNGCQLAAGEVYLLYRVPGSAVAELHYDGRDYDLRPTKAAVLGLEESASMAASDEEEKPSGPLGLQLEVKRGTLAIGTIDNRDTEVFELELTLKSSKYETVELRLGQDFFLEGNAPPQNAGRGNRGRGNRSRRMFVELQEDRMRMLAGTEFYDNTYQDRRMKELINGGVAISIEPGRPITAFFVFPNPPFENGLALHFPDKAPLDLVPAGDVLGEIRPGIPRGVARIPRAPLVGEPVKVHVIRGNVLIDDGGKSLSPQGPGPGNRFVALKFAIKGERQFVPRDYLMRDEAGTTFYPIAAAAGAAPAQRIPGDGYEPVKVVPGETDVVRKRKGELLFWQYARPEFLVVFALPDSSKTFEFSHGDRLLKITPAGPPVEWTEIRPDDALAAADDRPQRPARTKKNAESAASDDADRNAERAASQLTLGKLLLKKNADKARSYFEEAVRLSPDSDAAKEAKQLLEDLK